MAFGIRDSSFGFRKHHDKQVAVVQNGEEVCVVIRDAHPRGYVEVYSGVSESIQVYSESIHESFGVIWHW